MFEVDGIYANRKGKYRVLSIDPPKMTVRYEDGTTAELNISIQERIWENILGEEEVREASRQARRNRASKDTKFYIKTLSMVMEEDLSVPGWRERIVIAEPTAPELRFGDRLLFYAIENRVFFAVATVTGPATETVPKGTLYPDEEEETEELHFYPIDLDEYTRSLESAIDLDSVELESLPNYRQLLNRANRFLQVDEDDFELVAEALIEIAEEEEEEFEEEEEEEDYEY